MLEVHILNHYLGASLYSKTSAVRLMLSAAKDDLSRLASSHSKLIELVSSSTQSICLEDLAGQNNLIESLQSGQWFAAWIDYWLAWSGQPILHPSQLLCASEDLIDTHGLDWDCYILCPYTTEDIRLLGSILRWSVGCWNICIQNFSRPELIDKLYAPLSAHKPQQGREVKPSFLAMARALMDRDIAFNLEGGNDPMLRIGLGVNSQRISQKLTDQTSGWGMKYAKNKSLSKKLLQEGGLPVADSGVAMDFQTARKIADKIGYPIVLKPIAGDQGMGVVTNIKDFNSLKAAWSIAKDFKQSILVERHIKGSDYRFLAVNGQIIAGLERIPGGIVGDGINTIADLIEAENSFRDSNIKVVEGGSRLGLLKLSIDKEAKRILAEQNIESSSIPENKRRVQLRYTSNYSTGGGVRECLEEIHPFNILLLEKAAKIFNLDIIGIDVIAPTMKEPITGNGGVICEVNGLPGVLPHMLAQPERRLMSEVLSMLIKPKQQVYLVAILGKNSINCIRRIEELTLPHQPNVIIGCREGVFQSGYKARSTNGCKSVIQRQIVQDPSATGVLLELNEMEIERHGLPWPHIDLFILIDGDQPPRTSKIRDWLCQVADRVIRLEWAPDSNKFSSSLDHACMSAASLLVQGKSEKTP